MKLLITITLCIIFILAIPFLGVTYIIRSLYPSKRKEQSSFGDNYMLC